MLRHLMAAAGSLLMACLFALGYDFGYLPLHAVVTATASIALLIVCFFLLFRSKLNLNCKDPSLTFP